ncbi:MAG: ATP-binding protein [Candidatus Acidiferrales bacterium]
MGTPPLGFPRELLSQPWNARLDYFRTYTMAHPHLLATRETLLDAIRELAPNSLILVLGPTGVGKTTLRMKIEQLLTAEMLEEMKADPGRIPVVSVECIAPESGSFNWRDHFRRLLLQMEEPLVDYKLNPEAPVRIGNGVVRFMPSARAVGSEYHHAVERALHFRRPAAVLIDEAQHMARMGSGRRLSDQLDVLKSIANRTRTVHVLIGTYELLAFRNLSAQLSRRSIDIHFPRYRADDPEDRKAFRTVLRTFERQIPLLEPPDLVKDWEYLYERSIGCVGVLKDWLVRTLTAVFRRNGSVVTNHDLQEHAPSVSQCDKMLSEALEGESRLFESGEARCRLRTRLGLGTEERNREDPETSNAVRSPTALVSLRQQRRKPGHRRPGRDVVGCPKDSEHNYAGVSNF